MSISLEKLAEIINDNFSSPFLIDGGVVAELSDSENGKELSISIGRRDIQIDENGEIIGCGTFLSMPADTLVFDEE